MSVRSSVGSWFTLFRFGNSLTGLIGVIFGSLLALDQIPSGNLASITILSELRSIWGLLNWEGVIGLFL